MNLCRKSQRKLQSERFACDRETWNQSDQQGCLVPVKPGSVPDSSQTSKWHQSDQQGCLIPIRPARVPDTSQASKRA